jgi:nucleotide-binding universal stress UspA family protein
MKTEPLESPKEIAPACLVSALPVAHSAIQLKNILVPLDFSEMSLKSLQYAVPFAKQFGAKLTLLHVVQPTDDADLGCPVSFEEDDAAPFKRQCETIRATRIPSDLPVDIVVRYNLVFDGILELAREIGADLIITTTHGYTGWKHLTLGSTAETIVRRAPCPVLVVREVEHDFV